MATVAVKGLTFNTNKEQSWTPEFRHGLTQAPRSVTNEHRSLLCCIQLKIITNERRLQALGLYSTICLCTDASTTKLLGTWWTTAHQYPTSLIVNGYVLPVVMKSLFHGTGSVSMEVYSRFPDGYFPGWFFSRKDVSRKVVSRMVIFPDKTISYN